jgi:hypothetical protein
MEKYRTWIWQDLESWKEDVIDLMSDIITSEVKAEFLRHPPKYLVCDDSAWLDKIVKRVTGDKVNTLHILEQRLRDRFFAIRAFHGARVLDTASYYENGLLPLAGANFENLARKLFLSSEFPEITEENLESAISSAGREGREGRLYFEACERHLIDFCGHYMLYGSEYVCAIAANLMGARDYRQALKKRGTPTIFECNIPLSLISEGQLLAFAGITLEALFNNFRTPSKTHPSPGRGSAISLRRKLDPKYIVRHHSVRNVPDPLNNW